jgi:hypothetical protein
MSVRKALVLLVALSTFSLLVGCGSSSPPPVNAGFGPSDLSGNYVFSSSGVDASGAFLTMAGTLAANGTGGITGGTVDLIGQEITPPTPVAQPITGGSYKVGVDGRGQVSINTTTLNSNGVSTGITLMLDFVLTSSSHGLISEFDSNGTGSGTIDLQTAAVSQSQITGSYAFGLSGTGATDSGESLLTVGAITLGATGDATAGFEDINNAGEPLSAPINSATSFVSLSSTPGSALLATADTSFSFDVYPIDATHMKFIENDGAFLLEGDAYTQGTSLPTGALVYTMEGFDTGSFPIGMGGWLDTNSGGAITAAIEDFDDGSTATVAQASPSGGFTALSGGRSVLSLSSFVNGATNDLPETYNFAAYPYTYSGGSGIQLLEIDGEGITSGAAYPQSSTTLASSGNYGLNLSAINYSGGSGAFFEQDDIAEFASTSSGFGGSVDLNNDTQPLSYDQGLNGSYPNTPPVDSNGRGVATTNYFNYDFYVVSDSTFVLLEVDAGQTGLGTFELQSTPSSGAARRVVSMLRPAVRPHGALRKNDMKK